MQDHEIYMVYFPGYLGEVLQMFHIGPPVIHNALRKTPGEQKY